LNKTQLKNYIIAAGIALIATLLVGLTQPLSSGVAFVINTIIVLIALVAMMTLQARSLARLRPKEVAAALDPVRESGTVKWFNVDKGFGFIVRENGEDLFIHFRALREGQGGTENLAEGLRVEYQIGQGRKGPQAEDVVILD